jgi:hypothetical protein
LCRAARWWRFSCGFIAGGQVDKALESSDGCSRSIIETVVLTVGARLPRYQRRMACDEQTIQRPHAPAAATGIEFKLAFGAWYRLNQRDFGRDAIRILSEESALSR